MRVWVKFRSRLGGIRKHQGLKMRLRSVPRPSIPSADGGTTTPAPPLAVYALAGCAQKKDGVSVQNTVKHLFFPGTGSLCRLS